MCAPANVASGDGLMVPRASEHRSVLRPWTPAQRLKIDVLITCAEIARRAVAKPQTASARPRSDCPDMGRMPRCVGIVIVLILAARCWGEPPGVPRALVKCGELAIRVSAGQTGKAWLLRSSAWNFLAEQYWKLFYASSPSYARIYGYLDTNRFVCNAKCTVMPYAGTAAGSLGVQTVRVSIQSLSLLISVITGPEKWEQALSEAWKSYESDPRQFTKRLLSSVTASASKAVSVTASAALRETAVFLLGSMVVPQLNGALLIHGFYPWLYSQVLTPLLSPTAFPFNVVLESCALNAVDFMCESVPRTVVDWVVGRLRQPSTQPEGACPSSDPLLAMTEVDDDTVVVSRIADEVPQSATEADNEFVPVDDAIRQEPSGAEGVDKNNNDKPKENKLHVRLQMLVSRTIKTIVSKMTACFKFGNTFR